MTQPKKKRLYRPPAIASSETFERLALACNGTPTGQSKSTVRGSTCTTSGSS